MRPTQSPLYKRKPKRKKRKKNETHRSRMQQWGSMDSQASPSVLCAEYSHVHKILAQTTSLTCAWTRYSPVPGWLIFGLNKAQLQCTVSRNILVQCQWPEPQFVVLVSTAEGFPCLHLSWIVSGLVDDSFFHGWDDPLPFERWNIHGCQLETRKGDCLFQGCS